VKLIVGLGNPGVKYRGTRHNIGFMVADELARRADVTFETSPVEALVARIGKGPSGDPVLVAKPLTFMNASGEAAGALSRYFRVDAADLLVVLDDVDLPLGRLRARASGSAGGHNGLRSIIEHLGSEVPRLRVGVGRGPAAGDGASRRDLADHVLARFDPGEHEEVDRLTARAADAAEMFVTSGIGMVMNRYNGGDPAVTE
jgi:PTH1 family peptidyl-tRNA hydrolase